MIKLNYELFINKHDFSFDLTPGIIVLSCYDIEDYEQLLDNCPLRKIEGELVWPYKIEMPHATEHTIYKFFLISLNPENHYIYETNKMCKLQDLQYLKDNNLCLFCITYNGSLSGFKYGKNLCFDLIKSVYKIVIHKARIA